ncbi:MAG: hypothetical protein HYV35_02775 [Lentisphaerae bacterium]|nr:hypothetical protein [Lentisphaerota bacterium]
MKTLRWLVASALVGVGLSVSQQPAGAQTTGAVPQVQAVFGGTVGSIVAIPMPDGTNESVIFVSMDSPNSVFYAEVDHTLADPFATNNYAFQVVPDMDADADLGRPWWIDVHGPSERVFAACDDGLFSATVNSNSLVTNITGQMSFVLIEGNYLFAVSGGVPESSKTLYYGTLDASGNLTLGSALSTTFMGSVRVAVHPMSRKLYVLQTAATNSSLYISSSDYDAFSSGTTFTLVAIPLLDPTGMLNRSQLGISPDGRIFVGYSNTNLLYSDGAGWTNTGTDPAWAGSGIGLNIVFNGASNAYEVYYGYGASSNKGAVGTWAEIPRGGQRIPPFSHANAGSIEVDPVNSQVIYFTTDKGLGASTNRGVDAFELNYGLTAVQINDFDMSSSKDIAWLASKAGVRRATSFTTSPVWTDGEAPNAIVHGIAMDPADASGLTAYIGSALNVFRTTTGGGTNESDWTRLLNIRQGDAGVTNGINDGECRALQVDGSNIFAGFYSYNTVLTDGRLSLSTDGGQNWTALSTNINVNDIIINTESNVSVAYVAASTVTETDNGGVYRYEGGSALSRDLTNSVYMRYLARDSAGGLYAAGAVRNTEGDTNRYHVVVFYKVLGAAAWEQLPTNGLPTALGDQIIGRNGGPIIAVGKDASSNDVPILAIERTLYTLPEGAADWAALYTYPQGTEIKVLYWDDLLVGTTIGLYGQDLNVEPAVGPIIRANGAENSVTLASASPVTIAVAMNAGGYLGTDVDWWLVASANLVNWYYMNIALQWTPFSGNLAQCGYVHQGALFNLSPTTVLPAMNLPPGTYYFWFAVDYPMDGVLDVNGTIAYDQVTVVVQ